MKSKAALFAAVSLSACSLTFAEEDGQSSRPPSERGTGQGVGEDARSDSPRRGRGRPERRQRERRGPRPKEIEAAPLDLGAPGIAWYGRLDDGLAEAKRSNRPIFFMSAASQCGGVPGVF